MVQFCNGQDYSFICVLEPFKNGTMASKKVTTILKPNQTPTKQLWTILNLNIFGI